MTAISKISQVLSSIEKVKCLTDNFKSNFYLDPQKLELWISLDILEMEEHEGTVFILRKNKQFFNLYFISSSTHSLEMDLNILQTKYENSVFVVDLVGMENQMTEIQNLFLNNGYRLYTTLMRMSKVSTNFSARMKQEENIAYAQMTDVVTILSYFYEYFDPFSEQIPLVEEINKWIINKQLIIYRDERKVIQGFLIYEKIGQTAYLRYWFVHPIYRENKVGSTLIQFFFKECVSTKRQIFWVIRSNINAIKRYEHYGFKPESLIDDILINENFKYEKQNN